MSGGHTVGPWSVEHDEDAGHYCINAGGEAVGYVFYVDNKPGGRGEVDARLIHAAPDLLAALEGLTERLVKGDSIGFARIEAAVAAIAKARGEA